MEKKLLFFITVIYFFSQYSYVNIYAESCGKNSNNSELINVEISKNDVNKITLSEGNAVQIILDSAIDVSDIKFVGFTSQQHKSAISHNLKLYGYNAGKDKITLYIELNNNLYYEFDINVDITLNSSIPYANRKEIEQLNLFECDDYIKRKLELSGCIAENEDSLDIKKACEIIDSNENYREICQKLDEYCNFPNVISSFYGERDYVYWLDSKGLDRIEIGIDTGIITRCLSNDYGMDYAYQVMYPAKYKTDLSELFVEKENRMYKQYSQVQGIYVSDIVVGDINSDGKVDVTDLTELSLALLGDTKLTSAQQQSADVDGDGAVKLADLAKFRQFLSRVITSLR